jgi:hypothetical protein
MLGRMLVAQRERVFLKELLLKFLKPFINEQVSHIAVLFAGDNLSRIGTQCCNKTSWWRAEE